MKSERLVLTFQGHLGKGADDRSGRRSEAALHRAPKSTTKPRPALDKLVCDSFQKAPQSDLEKVRAGAQPAAIFRSLDRRARRVIRRRTTPRRGRAPGTSGRERT